MLIAERWMPIGEFCVLIGRLRMFYVNVRVSLTDVGLFEWRRWLLQLKRWVL
ncbi:hypothetical protein RPD76_09115 [Methylomonas sp. MV1]|uniref:hypothetical protein n=1 Tax=Methylomonas sp. MV1 TaxID=3073620 RepID=UPI0028A33103|nr:hypothetical protein [Methylomonas sp. MV1]MDT4330065.1 hypothetical protein [Methylomonas sp. MV1]